MEKETLKKYLL